MSFTCADSQICWVDLLKGVLICNLMEPTEPKFTFAALPADASIDLKHRRRPHTQEFRTMACIGGTIKFVALVGYNQNCGRENIVMKTWNLSSDRTKWDETTAISVRELWDSKSSVESALPQLTPTFPVVSRDEAEVVYVILNDTDRVQTLNILGNVCGVDKVRKAHYILGIDTAQKGVICHTKIDVNMASQFPNLIALELSEHLRISKVSNPVSPFPFLVSNLFPLFCIAYLSRFHFARIINESGN